MRFFLFFLLFLYNFGAHGYGKKTVSPTPIQYFTDDKKFLVTIFKKDLTITNLNDNSTLYAYENEYWFGKNVLFHGENVYFSTKNGTIQSRNIKTGKLNWFFEHSHFNQKNSPQIYFYKNNFLAFYGDGAFYNINYNNGKVYLNKNILKEKNYEKNYISISEFKDNELTFFAKDKKKKHKILKKIHLEDDEILLKS